MRGRELSNVQSCMSSPWLACPGLPAPPNVISRSDFSFGVRYPQTMPIQGVLIHLDVASTISLTYPFTRLVGDAKTRIVCKIIGPRTMGFNWAQYIRFLTAWFDRVSFLLQLGV